MELQMPEYQKKKIAHTTIENNGDVPELYAKLALFMEKLNII
jgi:dephospho-CoA kinase